MKHETPDHGHEITIWRSRPFIFLLAGFSVFMVLTYFVLGAFTTSWSHHVWPVKGPVMPPQTTPGWNDAPAQLETDAPLKLQQYRAVEFQRLHTTAWSDTNQTYASIPIERAMQVLSQAAADHRVGDVLPPVKPASPVDLQNQKSTEAPKP